MSFSVSDALDRVRDDRTLGSHAKLVLIILSTHADEYGLCFPDINTLASECSAGRSTVVSALGELVGAAWIRRYRFGWVRGIGGRKSNIYELLPTGDPLVSERAVRTVSRRFYSDAYARDGERCRYCGARERLSIDHVIPRCQGGLDDLENLAVCCRSCNSRKNGRTPEQAGMVLT